MDKEILGRSTWYYMHSLAHSCNTNGDVCSFKTVCKIILETYPCDECRNNINKFHSARVNELNHLLSPNDCKLWVYFLHRDVNSELDKPSLLHITHSHADIIKILDSMYSSCRK